ncbi:MAG: sugar transferase [Anaerolineales bacterium]|nr:MAG: sugar transferase [Anaerolineales bacterium]
MFGRLFDAAVSAAGLVILSPLFALLAIWIKLDSPGPAFYRGKRVGKDGRLFHLVKFRSMARDAAELGPGLTGRGDPRITRAGRVLRRTKLDELPQLFNVLRGEMSLVGPRPEDPRYVALYSPDQRRTLSTRPGITSLASLKYFDEEDLLRGGEADDLYTRVIMPRKLEMDLAYMESRTLWSDLKVIAMTIAAVFRSGRRQPNPDDSLPAAG